ncbi:DUF3857 domain-containing protein [Flammeovirga agarivorans]|uniref:DUF3857 and transglutaminase domain-containing protein n=1 Tax=Flammeovirga agarivorans TaxID=2726742 RepID=A0A7X8XYX7_9BACT|nr:DUF3857 domain-containing protein [Flammeovirga agarivorans]NLR94637.1 DUF3857 and transglutaminase domain-containing protein [Flammeovirga agarivorans]
MTIQFIKAYFLLLLLLLSSLQSFTQVLDDATFISINADRKKSIRRKVILQINNKDENYLSHVEIRHTSKQDFSFDYAKVLDQDGKVVRKLKKNEVFSRHAQSNQAFYQDDIITGFDLFWNQYPYTIEYSYTQVEKEYLYYAFWRPIYDQEAFTVHSSLEVHLRLNFDFQKKSSDELTYFHSKSQSNSILKWDAFHVKYPKQNELLSSRPVFPQVKLIPKEFIYAIHGSTESWSSFGTWMDQLNSGSTNITSNEKEKIENLINGLNTKEEIIKTIYHYLQDHTKYINVSIDAGGLKSYPASYVCEKKYGDCKALTTYMKGMLQSVGIESFYTLVKAGVQKKPIDINLPSQQFNHVILMVPIESDTIWLENTSNCLPFNYIGTFTQDRKALVVDGEDSHLVHLPKLTINDVLVEKNFDYMISENDSSNIKVNITLRGEKFEKSRYSIFKDGGNFIEEMARNHVDMKDFIIKNQVIIDNNRDSTFLKVSLTGISTSVIRKIGNLQVIQPLKLTIPDFEKPSFRETNVSINYPINEQHISELYFNFSEKKEITIPKNIIIENNFGIYKAKFLLNEGHLTITEKLLFYDNKINLEEYSEFYKFISQIKNYKKKSAIILK